MLQQNIERRGFCSFPFQRLKVDPEGDATMCCFHQRKCLGNILKTSIEEVWFSSLAEGIRKTTLKDQLHPTCADSTCPFICVQKQLSSLKKPFFHPIYPTELEIDLPSQWCNIGGLRPTRKNPACLMCERHTRFVRQEDRLKEICKTLRPFVVNFTQVHIQGVAEPFWKNRIFEIINDLGVKKETLLTTTTNGTILTKDRMEKWLIYPHTTLTFSIDAGRAKTYRKLRRWDYYDKVVENLLCYSEARGPTQRLQIHNNLNLLNINEVVEMVELAAKAQAITSNSIQHTALQESVSKK